ncbi:hypothetical protein [Pseudomonas juntendi]|uniref:hypothetical protein n=1 Tax=Pseudomonas juntendi TaxID=2666183 RepID=UPI0031FBB1BA
MITEKGAIFAMACAFVGGLGFGHSLGTNTRPAPHPAPCYQTGNQRQLSPHETQPEPTPALAPGRWIDERYQL